ERIADHQGRFYTFHDALCEPRPVQDHLPILIGGSGPRKTLRTTAKYADAWNTGGSLDEVRVKVANLHARCADEGRDPVEIEQTYSDWVLIRDDPAEARRALQELAVRNGDTLGDDEEALVGSPDLLAEQLRPIFELGFTHLIADLLAPYDAETIE